MHSWIAIALLALLLQGPDPAEIKIIEYLKANVKPGSRVVVSDLTNNVFTTPDERKALERLFNTFFKIPMFIVQYNTSTKKIPTLQELSEQFNFKVPGQADVMLRIMESDPRVPKFLTRDASTGEITAIDVSKIQGHPQFGRFVERTLTGWEGRPAPPFEIAAYDGKPLTSAQVAGQPHLVYFWFTNCPPCVRISPILVELHNKYAARGFKIVGINNDKVLELPYDDAMRARYAAEHGMKFTNGHATAQMQQAYGGVSVFPTLFFVDKTGTVVKHFVNFQDKAILEAAIEEALK